MQGLSAVLLEADIESGEFQPPNMSLADTKESF